MKDVYLHCACWSIPTECLPPYRYIIRRYYNTQFGISVSYHLFPSSLCASRIVLSSSFVHGDFLMAGLRWLCQRSRHCLPWVHCKHNCYSKTLCRHTDIYTHTHGYRHVHTRIQAHSYTHTLYLLLSPSLACGLRLPIFISVFYEYDAHIFHFVCCVYTPFFHRKTGG